MVKIKIVITCNWSDEKQQHSCLFHIFFYESAINFQLFSFLPPFFFHIDQLQNIITFERLWSVRDSVITWTSVDDWRTLWLLLLHHTHSCVAKSVRVTELCTVSVGLHLQTRSNALTFITNLSLLNSCYRISLFNSCYRISLLKSCYLISLLNSCYRIYLYSIVATGYLYSRVATGY